MGAETGAGGMPRLRTFGQHLLEKAPVAGAPVGPDGVVARVVPSTGVAEVGSGASLENEVAQRAADHVGATGAFLEDFRPWRRLESPHGPARDGERDEKEKPAAHARNNGEGSPGVKRKWRDAASSST